MGKLPSNRSFTAEFDGVCLKKLAHLVVYSEFNEVCALVIDRLSLDPFAFPTVAPLTHIRAIKTEPVGNCPGIVFIFRIIPDDMRVIVVEAYPRAVK